MSDVFQALFGVIAGPLFVVVGFLMIRFTLSFMGINAEPVFSILIALTPIWLPTLLLYLFYERWMLFVRTRFAINNGRTTLRIKLPQEIFKSPEAMESVFTQIYNPASVDNMWQGFIDGKAPLMYSFELVSIGGDVRFYINVPTKKTKNAVESQLYAQYPGIEIIEETVDYTAEIPWDTEKYEYMSFHMTKKEAQEFPIKTYIDFGLDKMPKEEEKFEPMAAMLEQLSNISPHERIWLQILAKPHVKKIFKGGHISSLPSWEKKVAEKIDELIGRDRKTKLGPGEFENMPRQTTGERDTIAAMERNAGKYAYDTAIRWMYITKKGHFNGDIIGPMLRTFSTYDIIGRNGLGPRWRTDFDYNWISDFTGSRKLTMKKLELRHYKLRKYIPAGAGDRAKVMSVEELATIFHIPGSSVLTPSLARIPSTRSEAPSNLPINREE